MNKNITFFIKNIFRIILGFIIKTNDNIVLLGNKPTPFFKGNNAKEQFIHNTKYLYLSLSNTEKSIKTVYLCDNQKMCNIFKEKGYKHVYSRNSIKGILNSLKAKYWFSDYDITSINNSIFFNNAIYINAWHGIPLKKIGADSEHLYKPIKLNSFFNFIYNKLRIKINFLIVNSKYEQSCYETAFLTEKKKIKILGSPRLDVLLHDIPNAEMFMEEDFNNIKNFKAQGKKIFIYMPTFRDTGKDISGWLKSDKLKEFLHNNNAILVCKLHPGDKNSLDFELSEDFYKMDSDSDVYPILKYTDALITDYSSVYYDYLLLDKPILYYSPDLKEYQEKCRGFYEPYENLTAGAITQTEDDLFNAMQNVINGIDNYKEKRKALRDRMFKYQDGRNCERVIEWIKSLDK